MVFSDKTIKINKSHEISYGMLLLWGIITTFQMLSILAFNNWIWTPTVFVMLADAFLMIRRQSEDQTEKMKVLEDRIKKLEEKE